MNTEFLSILQKLVAEHGETVLADPRRVSAFFADLAREVPKPQKTALVKCLELGSAQILKNVEEADRANHKQRLAQKLHDEEGLAESLCAATLDLLERVLFGEAQVKTFCKNQSCGKELQEEWEFCPFCGTPVAGQNAAPQSVSAKGVSGSDQTIKQEKAISGRLIRTFENHEKNVTSVAFSPDGQVYHFRGRG